MSHSHRHSNSTAKLGAAVLINVLLSVVQFIFGIFSGSLSLIADALHNFSDAGALVVALLAKKIGGKAADDQLSYGYKRAEILGALINSTSLLIVGVYLCYQAIVRYFNPQPIDGWIVVWVASLALVIDVVTAVLTHKAGAKDSMNIRAAFIHNVSDALASVVVVIAGTLIILYQLYVVDLVATVLISIYVIYHGLDLVKKSIRILMQAVPDGVDLQKVRRSLISIEGVEDASHIHLWQLDEKMTFFEGHILISATAEQKNISHKIRALLKDEYSVGHTTLELKTSDNT
ncbi:cation transporter [bacterium]|nr:cation transporter [bacterium]